MASLWLTPAPIDDAVGGLLDPLQLAHAAEIDDRIEPPHLLGHPQADVGTAGDDGGVGLGEQHLGQRVDGGRRDEPAPPIADDQRLLVVRARAAAPAVSPASGLDRIGPRARLA